MKKKNLLLLALAMLGLKTATMAQNNQYALEFNGSGDAVNFANNNLMTFSTNSFSILTWARTFDTSIPGTQEIISNGTCACGPIQDKGYRIFFQNYGQPKLTIQVGGTGSVANNIDAGFVPQDSVWYHIGMILNRQQDKMFLYINGLLEDSLDISSLGDMANPATIDFGRLRWYDTGNVGEYLNGNIDDVIYFNYALSPSGVWDYYNCPPLSTSPGVIGMWNFEEGSGPTILDSSINNTSSSIIGSPTWSTDAPVYNCCILNVTTQPVSQTSNINSNVQFVAGSSDPSATYQWQTDLGVGFQNLNSVGQYSGTTNDTLTVSNVTMSNNNQPFRCIVSSGSCSDTSNVAVLTVNNNVGINETSRDNLFSVFPNPAQSVINVKADIKLIGQVYSIYDNTGRAVLSGKLNSENTTIELGNLSGGIYMFSAGENMKQTFKVIKE